MVTLRRTRAGLALGMLLSIAACSAEPAGPDTTDAEASIRVSANVSNTPINILVVTVSATDIPVSPVFNLPVVAGIASGTVRVPPGAARTFTVTAYDVSGEITHDGAATRDVQRGQNPPLSIPLTPRSGQVPLTISFGDFSVVVEPAAAEIDLAAALPLQLTVTVTDGEGNVLASPDVAWATTDPSRAQVNVQGVVTGLLAGEVDIVATYNGIAGISHITLVGALPTFWYPDLDSDGFGDETGAIPAVSGEEPPSGYVTIAGDCMDILASVYPGADEIFDSIDNDCDGIADELVDVVIYPDSDEDAYGGEPGQLAQTDENGFLNLPAGFVMLQGDCNDADPAIFPGAAEIADGIDNDCDVMIDELAYIQDQDGDGYGNIATQVESEGPPVGYILMSASLGFDCDDFSATVNPGATEVPADGIDNDCNGVVD